MTQMLPLPLFRLALLLGLLTYSSAGTWAQGVPYQVPLGSAVAYGLLSGGNLVAQDGAGNDLSIQVIGKAGANGAIDKQVTATAGLFAQASGTAPQALHDFQAAKTYCDQLSGQASALPGQLTSQALTGGGYTISSDALLSQSSMLTINADTAPVVIIHIAGDLQLAAPSQIRAFI